MENFFWLRRYSSSWAYRYWWLSTSSGIFIFARIFQGAGREVLPLLRSVVLAIQVQAENSDTEYGVGWLPLGGYCKISGMIDESMDKEAMAQPPKPYEFRSKPAWQRLIIMIGGVLVNFYLGVLSFYIMILLRVGESSTCLPRMRNMELYATLYCLMPGCEWGYDLILG